MMAGLRVPDALVAAIRSGDTVVLRQLLDDEPGLASSAIGGAHGNRTNPIARTCLLGAEHPVAGVAQPRHDIAVVVEPLVDRGGPDRHVRMLALELRDALRRRQKADEADVAGAARLQQRGAGAGLRTRPTRPPAGLPDTGRSSTGTKGAPGMGARRPVAAAA